MIRGNGRTATPAPADPELKTLREQVARLEQENAKLKSAAVAPRPGIAPGDFASAVQHALDKLQTQLYAMNNPVSNFAVKEFRMEASVWMSVTPLGAVEYRFAVPGESVDAASLTRVTLDLVPLAKPGAANTYTPADFQPELGIESIEGLTAPQRRELHAQAIDTVTDFLSVGTRSRTSVQLVSLLKLTRARFAGMMATAQLLTLKGMDGGRATVLVAAGVGSLAALAACEPATLATRFNEKRAQLGRNDVQPLAAEECTRLILAAKTFLGQPAPAAT